MAKKHKELEHIKAWAAMHRTEDIAAELAKGLVDAGHLPPGLTTADALLRLAAALKIPIELPDDE